MLLLNSRFSRIADILSARAQRANSLTHSLDEISGLRPLADRMSAIRCDNYSVVAR